MSVKYTCGLFLIDARQKVLLVHPTGHPLSAWSIPKGVAEAGEDFLGAAMRELREETSLDVSVYAYHVTQVRKIGEYPYYRGPKTLVAFAIWLDVDLSQVPLHCQTLVDDDFAENDGFKWVDLTDLRPLVHHTQQSAAWEVKKYR